MNTFIIVILVNALFFRWLWAWITGWGWTAAGGIAQIIAAIFAAYNIWQAKKTIKQAEAERKLSVEPDWDVYSAETTDSSRESGIRTAEIRLENTGSGPARKPRCEFVAGDGNQPRHIQLGSGKAVVPTKTLDVAVQWCDDQPLDGNLIISCETRFGETVTKKFHLRTWLREGGHFSSCSVERVDDESP